VIELFNAAEIEKLGVAGRFVADVLEALRDAADVGVNLLELDALAAKMIAERGAVSCYVDYHPSFGAMPFGKVLCTSVNDAVLHGLPHDYRLQDGDLLSVDFACSVDGWVADSAVSMVVGTPLAGRLADWSVFRTMLLGSVLMGLTLVTFTVTAQWLVPGLVTIFVLSVVSSLLVVNLQMRLMQVAGEAQTIGAAMNHASLNIANALGAWLGGVVVAAGFSYTATSWVGAGLSLLGLLVLIASATLHRRTR